MAVCIVVCMIVGYLFGCIQTGYIVGRVNKIDIRDYGSGNSGTTNTLRTLGKTAAIITFLGDAVKGLVAVNLARYVIMPAFHVEGEAYLWLLTGFAVVLGHNFPFYLGFKGGKEFRLWIARAQWCGEIDDAKDDCRYASQDVGRYFIRRASLESQRFRGNRRPYRNAAFVR